MINLLGFIGSILLALSAIPEVFRSIKDNKCYVGYGMLISWFVGELFLIIYILFTNIDIILLTNYLINIILVTILLIYKLKYK